MATPTTRSLARWGRLVSSPRAALLLLVGLLLAATACTKSEAGQAAPLRTTDPTTGQSSGSAAPTVAIPPRPRELKLNDVDPCGLITEQQRAELKIDRARKRTSASQQYKGMQECVLDISKQQPFYHYIVAAVTNEGIAPWLTGKRNVTTRLGTVAGFPTVTYWTVGAHDTSADGCFASVDVADGQQLIVDTNNDGSHSFTLEQMCQRAERAAGLAIQTLQTLR